MFSPDAAKKGGRRFKPPRNPCASTGNRPDCALKRAWSDLWPPGPRESTLLPHAFLPIGGGKSKAWLPTCPPGHWQPITLHSGAPTNSELEKIVLVSKNWRQRTGVKEGGCRNLGLSPPQMPKSAAHPPPIVKIATGSSDRVEMLTAVFLSNGEANQRKET